MEGTLAQILMFGGNFAPVGWAFCQGQIISISSNTALFAIMGTSFGGNGQTTYGLPDFRGRAPVGMGQGPGLSAFSWGQVGGAETATLTTNNMPAHAHSVTVNQPVSDINGSLDQPQGNIPAVTEASAYSTLASNGTMANVNLNLTSAGNSQPFSLMQPYLAVTFLICTQGVFPSRD
jgi:microcystin-dependent protein